MWQIKALFATVLALMLAACSNPQFLLNPLSNPAATKVRHSIDSAVETSTLKPLVWGNFLSPPKGEFFKPVLPTDSRNAVVYVYRPESAWNDAEVQAPGFFLNGRFISGLKGGSYFWFEVPASTYYFSAKRPFAFFYLKTIFEADLNLEGGKSYYFRYDEEKPGPKKAARGAALLVVGPLQQMPMLQGRSEIAQARAMGAGSVVLADAQPQWAPFEFYADARPVAPASLDALTGTPRELNIEDEIRPTQGPATTASQPPPKRRWWHIVNRK